MEEYYKLLEAVEQYYGVGSDQWVQIAQYGLNADNAASILRQTPGISTTVSNSGKVLSYTVDNTVSLATQNAGAVINSNAQLPALSRTTTVRPPANMVVDSTGKVVAESGLKTVSSGTTVAATMSKVAIGVAAASAALQLGAAIDTTLYNINPQFWNDHNLWAVNPETWDGLTTNQTGKNLLNMVFGINKSNNSTQAYVDERLLAQVAQYLAGISAFDPATNTATVDTPTGLYPNFYAQLPIYYGTSLVFTGMYISGGGSTSAPPSEAIQNLSATSPVYVCAYLFNDTKVFVKAFSTAAFSFDYVTHNQYGVYTQHRTSNGPYYVNAKPVYYADVVNSVDLTNINITSMPVNMKNLYGYENNMAYVICYGTHSETRPLDGLTPQPGATLPTGITTDMTTAAVLDRLRELYPGLFDGAITNSVVQDDGSTETYTYLPVPIPDGVTYNNITEVLEPIGGDDQNQQNKVVTPNVPQNVIDTLLELITATNPENPTETPTEIPPEEIPPTGDGDTPIPIVPTGSAEALYSIYNPSQAELNSFGSWLWSSNFVDQLLKVFNDPMQAIIGLHKIFATPAVSGTGTIKVGYLDSGVSSNLVGNQYTTVNCGTVNLYEYFGNVLDYTQTDVYLYLPFVGIVQINVDDVMRAAINVTYKVDVLTGACMCSVNVTRDLHGGQLYTYSGNCAVQYPLSSGSYMGIVSSMLSIAGSVIGTAATGGAALPLALGLGASAISSAKTRVEHSGSIGGNVGAMGIKNPYFIIRRPQTAIANNFTEYNGESVNTYTTVGSCSGFTRAKYVNLENIPGATGEELSMIENTLKDGILI